MRVCFYHAEPEWAGRARAFADAAVAMRGRGYEVTFVCERGSAVERRLEEGGHDPIGIRKGGLLGWRRLASRAPDAAAAWPIDAMAEGFVYATTIARDRTRWRT